MTPSPLQLLLLLAIVLLLFGAGKLPRIMGDIGKGIRSLREGLKEDESPKEISDKSEDKTGTNG